MARVVIVGGGVNGVGSAVALLRLYPECQVTIVAQDFNPDTTGDGAAGLWTPHLIGDTPEDKIIEWLQATWELFHGWWEQGEARERGVSLVHGAFLFSQSHTPRKPWSHVPLGYTDLTPEQSAKYGAKFRSGYSFGSFTAEASKFLPGLMQEVRARGGRLEVRRLATLEEAAAEADLVINCCGVGARELVPDPSVFPCRGQVMRVKAPWVKSFLCDDSGDDNIKYIIPNQETVVLGGTQQDNDWRREVDAGDSNKIWTGCTSLLPSLKGAEVVKEWVGFRPCRKKGVRLEADDIRLATRTVPVVHNYGHGGCGVALFWGCSLEVARIASGILHRHHAPSSKL